MKKIQQSYVDVLHRLQLAILATRKAGNITFVYCMCPAFEDIAFAMGGHKLEETLTPLFKKDVTEYFKMPHRTSIENQFSISYLEEDWYPPKAAQLRTAFLNWVIEKNEELLAQAD